MGHREEREVSLLIVLLQYLVGKESLCSKYIVGFKYLSVCLSLPPNPLSNPGMGG